MTKYHVVNVTKDGTTEIIKTYDSYGEAKVSHTLLKNQYNNLGITYGTSFLTIEYGVVGFEKADDCSFNVEYRNDANGKDGYTNGCYGADAAFLEYNYGDNQVKFMLSGVIGWAEGKDVTIYPIEQVSKSSTYSVKDGYLYHHISSDIHALDYDTSVKLEKDVSGLSEGKTYYSYDGHYFYEDFRKMINDYRDDTHKQSKIKTLLSITISSIFLKEPPVIIKKKIWTHTLKINWQSIIPSHLFMIRIIRFMIF